MGLKCAFSILPNTTVYWENNHATLILGGAIYMSMMVAPSVTVLLLLNLYHKKNASFNSLARICPMVLMSNLFSRTTLVMMQEVCYMVVQ